MLSVVVHLRARPGHREDLLGAITRNAAASLTVEPGCRRFDVLVARDDEDLVLLYEIYDDDEAFATHLASPHFAEWRAIRDDLVVADGHVTELADVVGTSTG